MLKNLKGIALEVTEDCNLACHYCYETQKRIQRPPQYMDDTIGFQSVRWLLENFSNSNVNPTISFWGGEPLLNFNLIKKIVNHCRSEYEREFFFSIVTNGTLLSSKILNYLHSEHFHIILSLDGPEQVHNRNRCFSNGGGSFRLIKPAIQPLISNFPDTLALFTVCPNTVNEMADSCSFLIELGFKRISFSFSFTSEWNMQTEQEYLNQLDEVIDLWREAIAKDDHVAILPIENILRYFLKNKPIKCSAANRMVSIDTNGNIYPCHRFCGFYDIRKSYVIGNILNGGIREEALIKFNSNHVSYSPIEHMQQKHPELISCPARRAWEASNGTFTSNDFHSRISDLLIDRILKIHYAMYTEKILPYLELYIAIIDQE
jgi:uncharacterized protein